MPLVNVVNDSVEQDTFVPKPTSLYRNFDAQAMIGCELDPKMLFAESRQMSCQCFTEEYFRKHRDFYCCPRCGQRVVLPGDRVSHGKLFHRDKSHMMLGDLTVFTTPEPCIEDRRLWLGDEMFKAGLRIFAGVMAVRTNDARQAVCYRGATCFGDIDFARAKERVRDALLPLAMWNENKFGLWAILGAT